MEMLDQRRVTIRQREKKESELKLMCSLQLRAAIYHSATLFYFARAEARQASPSSFGGGTSSKKLIHEGEIRQGSNNEKMAPF